MSEDELREIEERYGKSEKWDLLSDTGKLYVDAYHGERARTDIPALVAEVRKLKSSVMSCEELEEKLKKAQDDAENAWITVDGLVAFNAELREENERLRAENERLNKLQWDTETERLQQTANRDLWKERFEYLRGQVHAFLSYDLDDPETRRRSIDELKVIL